MSWDWERPAEAFPVAGRLWQLLCLMFHIQTPPSPSTEFSFSSADLTLAHHSQLGTLQTLEPLQAELRYLSIGSH